MTSAYLAEEDTVHLLPEGMVAKARLDRMATATSVLVALRATERADVPLAIQHTAADAQPLGDSSLSIRMPVVCSTARLIDHRWRCGCRCGS